MEKRPPQTTSSRPQHAGSPRGNDAVGHSDHDEPKASPTSDRYRTETANTKPGELGSTK